MELKKINAPSSTISRDMNEMSANIGNVYETVKIIAKRSNQINVEIKAELDKKTTGVFIVERKHRRSFRKP